MKISIIILAFLLSFSSLFALPFGSTQNTLIHYEDSKSVQNELYISSGFSLSSSFEGNYRVCERSGTCFVQTLDYDSYRRTNGVIQRDSVERNTVQVLFGH